MKESNFFLAHTEQSRLKKALTKVMEQHANQSKTQIAQEHNGCRDIAVNSGIWPGSNGHQHRMQELNDSIEQMQDIVAGKV